jgi:hypothetical protein
MGSENYVDYLKTPVVLLIHRLTVSLSVIENEICFRVYCLTHVLS